MTTAGTSVSMLGYHGNITWKAHSGGGIDIHIPAIPPPQMPSHDAWTFKLVKLGNAWMLLHGHTVTTLRPPQGSVKFLQVLNLVSFKQTHHKPLRMYCVGGGLQWDWSNGTRLWTPWSSTDSLWWCMILYSDSKPARLHGRSNQKMLIKC